MAGVRRFRGRVPVLAVLVSASALMLLSAPVSALLQEPIADEQGASRPAGEAPEMPSDEADALSQDPAENNRAPGFPVAGCPQVETLAAADEAGTGGEDQIPAPPSCPEVEPPAAAGEAGAGGEDQVSAPPATATPVAPTPTTTPSGTVVVPTPTVGPRAVPLQAAVYLGLVRFTLAGFSPESAVIVVDSLSAEALDVVVPVGTWFDPIPGVKVSSLPPLFFDPRPTATPQPTATPIARSAVDLDRGSLGWVVTSEASVPIRGIGSKAVASLRVVEVRVASGGGCRVAPGLNFLHGLLSLQAFQQETYRVQQFAVNIVLYNPPLASLTLETPGGASSGPSADENSRIRSLLRQAEVNLEAYNVLC